MAAGQEAWAGWPRGSSRGGAQTWGPRGPPEGQKEEGARRGEEPGARHGGNLSKGVWEAREELRGSLSSGRPRGDPRTLKGPPARDLPNGLPRLEKGARREPHPGAPGEAKGPLQKGPTHAGCKKNHPPPGRAFVWGQIGPDMFWDAAPMKPGEKPGGDPGFPPQTPGRPARPKRWLGLENSPGV